MIWVILLVIHLILALLGLTLGRACHESEWGTFILFCFIPFVGPIFAIYCYAMIYAEKHKSE